MANVKQVVIILIGSLVLLGGMAYWFTKDTSRPELILDELAQNELTAPLTPEETEVTNPAITNTMNPTAVLTTNQGVIKLELYTDTMPVTAGNFIELANAGFYDGIKFHRIIDGFMIQGGDPNTKSDDVSSYGFGGPGYAIKDEFVEGELLSNRRGTIAMANSGPNTGGSQFFINLVDNINLDFNVPDPNDSRHPVFGRVIEGMDVVDAIGKVTTNRTGLPVEPVVIESVEIVQN